MQASTERELEIAFASLRDGRRAGDRLRPVPEQHSEQVAALALRHAMPTMHQFREFPLAGGLMGYGGAITDSYRLVGEYTGRILKGEKPADLPVMQATIFELVINLQTARAVGLDIPATLIARADEVIE